ncbi:MAG: hypothetical protein J3R72DRAFT_10740 [Linnemannia gamsii]|nr:MAG: hypothetical protein J3R72DRAFT_10740 [Linnemannia gamsii]
MRLKAPVLLLTLSCCPYILGQPDCFFPLAGAKTKHPFPSLCVTSKDKHTSHAFFWPCHASRKRKRKQERGKPQVNRRAG